MLRKAFEKRIEQIQLQMSADNECKKMLELKAELYRRNPAHVEILLELEELLSAYDQRIHKKLYIYGVRDGMNLMVDGSSPTLEIHE